MIYAYLRISTGRQSVENQRFEILKATNAKKVLIDEWIEETVSGTKGSQERQLGFILNKVTKGDVIYVTELSRIGRSLLEIMSILHQCMSKETIVVSIKEGYELGNNISSKVLAFAFGLSAEIERQLISQRTKESLERKKAEGLILGRPIGSKSKETKLSGKEGAIREMLSNKISYSAIGRILGVNRQTVTNFVKSRRL
ncbi:DNA invertase Pin-like site-specific DNA recombinase [Larkinella arboricola]|uniref:DNA invertase Pin-like site-specific DNA recombinase n=1 Tax=Larkinella arboricola TaxID=643671 RepID=A0A327WPJ9_LARAB|nr:master DNA invertase Mpi family serine-type recombinase [Larkinella arboricola]RAJ92246.1 DNA invertase Pin-like site-specific DNA recombinase [Larkinella arboricola]